jgi:hypothetical protein
VSDQSDIGAEYEELDLLVDADQLTLYSIEYMEDAIPGWVSQPANPETIMMEATGQMAGEVAAQAATVPDEAMAYLGTSVYGFPLIDGAPARGTATITFAASTPATMIPQGTEVVVPHPSGVPFVFETDRDITATEGGGTAALSVIASEYGAAQNGCFGPGEFQEDYEGVDSIVVNTTTGGTDPEDPTDYLARFSTYLSILTARPILPIDFARRAQLNPRVERAVALDLYQPSTAEGGYGTPRTASTITNVERCTTVVITAAAGAAPPADLMQEVWTDLDTNREVNFQVYVIPPGANGAYTGIDVRATVRPYPGTSDADAQAQAADQLAQWLNPQNWGVVPGAGAAQDWATDTKVRIYEAVDWLNRAPAIFYVVAVTMKKSTDPVGSFAATDITLTGAVPMPTLGAAPVITIGS